MSLKLAPKTQDFQGNKCYDIAPLGSKSERVQYREDQRGREDGKDKRGRENEGYERGGGGHWGKKVNPLIGETSGFEASIYYHIINQY